MPWRPSPRTSSSWCVPTSSPRATSTPAPTTGGCWSPSSPSGRSKPPPPPATWRARHERLDRGGRADRRAAARHPVAGQRGAALRTSAGPAAAIGLPAPRPGPHRYARRLRARRLRRVHRARRRQADAVVPDVRRHGPGPRDHHRRGHRQRPRGDEPGAAGVRRVPRAAVRFLHTGVHHDDHRLPRREPRPHPRGGPGGHLGKPVPLHGVPEHRQGRRSCRRDPPRGTRAARRPGAGLRGRGDAMSTRQFGEKVQRREDPRLLTGNGRYLDDLGHTALAAAFVRSPHAHARVVDIDIDDAWEVDGVEAIYTWEDLPGRVAEPLPVLIPHPALTHARTGYCLAKDEVNHVGEAVVMVVARDRYLAEDAAQRIRVTYEQLPVVVGIDNARSGARLVHDDVPDNVSAHLLQEVGDLETAMAAAPNRLTLDLAIERSACTPMEGKGVYAKWDLDEGSLRLYSSTQTTTGVRAAVAAKLGMPLAKVECIAPDVGGGFGVKIMHPWPEEVLVPWAARNLRREVKWTEDRREHFISSAHERGQLQEVTVGFDDEGHLLALDVRFWHDNGAYTPYGI